MWSRQEYHKVPWQQVCATQDALALYCFEKRRKSTADRFRWPCASIGPLAVLPFDTWKSTRAWPSRFLRTRIDFVFDFSFRSSLLSRTPRSLSWRMSDHAEEILRVLRSAGSECSWMSLIGASLNRIPRELETCGRFPNLTQLYLGHNSIERLSDNFFRANTSLRGLYLQNNRLESLPPEICLLTNLQELYLSSNKLHQLPSLKSLLRLDCLWLDDNPQLPISLQRNVSRSKHYTQGLIADVSKQYQPRLEHCERAINAFLIVVVFRGGPFELPREILGIISEQIWLHRFDDEWETLE